MASQFNASQFKIVGIIGNKITPAIIETLQALAAYLRQLKQPFLINHEIAGVLNDPTITAVSLSDLSQKCELLIVVGGDGSLLHAAHKIIENEVPILGINRGRLGFLTDIHPHMLEKIEPILAGEYVLEKRFLLSATIEHQGKIQGTNIALNEIALIPDLIPHMNTFEIYINQQFVCSQESDGLIVATPTGSTAYALSGGGPILHPQLDAIVLVPMFPHTLSIRPIVVDGNNHITIIVSPNNNATPRVSCDGQTAMNAPPGSLIHIVKKEKQLHLVHPIDYDYYESLRSKLHWGRKLHYSE